MTSPRSCFATTSYARFSQLDAISSAPSDANDRSAFFQTAFPLSMFSIISPTEYFSVKPSIAPSTIPSTSASALDLPFWIPSYTESAATCEPMTQFIVSAIASCAPAPAAPPTVPTSPVETAMLTALSSADVPA